MSVITLEQKIADAQLVLKNGPYQNLNKRFKVRRIVKRIIAKHVEPEDLANGT